ncbi:MAG: hypothetical protein M3277_04660 [Actinomycetota bacterium]|nr:hypothetical protein [Actinomycetota bacterium]
MDGWDRRTLLAGALAPIFWIAGVILSESGDKRPDFNASPDEILSYVEGNHSRILIGGLVFLFGGLLFMWFLGGFRSRAMAAEGGTGRLTATAFGTGLAFIIGIMATWAPQFSLGIFMEEQGTGLAPEAAQALWLAGDGFFVIAEIGLAGFMFATALLILKGLGLPKWMAWLGILMTIVLLIAPIGWAVMIFIFPFWLILASILLYRQPAAPTATVP